MQAADRRYYLQSRAGLTTIAENYVGLPMERVVTTLDHHGNTSAASIPLALDEAVRTGMLRPGHRIVVEGVGGGFTWGAALIDF